MKSKERSAPFESLAKQARLRIVKNQIDTILEALEKPVVLARMLGVSPAQVTRWRTTQLPDLRNRDRLRRLADTVGLLLQAYQPSVAGAWFRSPNVHPEDGGGTPADLIQRDQWDALRSYAEEAASEGYG
ncbi:MAG: hypothetical protein KY444_11120 [Gemmatimonadetes bacterium]|nr:hypothetical protein [Gemmatimonadota bacterium]